MSLLPLRNTARVGAAVIGTGFIAAVHMDALRRIGVPLRGVLTRDAGRPARPGSTPTSTTTSTPCVPTEPSTSST